MTSVAASLGVILLSGFIAAAAAAAAADKVVCDLYAAVGGSTTLPLYFKGMTDKHILRWSHNGTVVFYKQGKVSMGKPGDITATGSLLLSNLQFSSAGVYEGHVLHPNSTLAKMWSGRLCVQNNVSKPLLSYRCSGSSSVSLMCDVAKDQGVEFSWTLMDEKTLAGEAKETLTVPLAQLNGGKSFRCDVENKISAERSDAVRPDCKPAAALLQKVVCIPVKKVAAMMAGAGGVILVLIAALVTTCIYFKCNPRTRAGLKDKGDVRMLSVNKRELESVGPDYETMCPTKEDPPTVSPSPKPSPRACYQSVTAPDSQTGSGPLQPTTTTEGEQPSPVPKPRTKPVNL